MLEGQATFYQIPMLMPEQQPETLPEHWFWRQREAMAQQQAQMPQFASAPLWLRETLIFPYLGGADFIGWFVRTHHGPRAVRRRHAGLHRADPPPRPLRRRGPSRWQLAFTAPAPDTVRYEDDLGEFEIGLLFSQLLHDSSDDQGTASSPRAGAAIATGLRRRTPTRWCGTRCGTTPRRATGSSRGLTPPVDGAPRRRMPVAATGSIPLTIDGLPGARLVDAPPDWVGLECPCRK